MAKENKAPKRGDNKETFSVVMPNQPDQAANYRKVNGEREKSKQ